MLERRPAGLENDSGRNDVSCCRRCRLVKNELSPGTPVLPCKRRFLPDLYARLVLHTKASTLIARLNGQDRSSWAETVCNLAWRLTSRLGKLLSCSRGASGEEGAGSQWRTLDSPRDSPSPAPREAGQLDEVTSSRIKSSVGGGERPDAHARTFVTDVAGGVTGHRALVATRSFPVVHKVGILLPNLCLMLLEPACELAWAMGERHGALLKRSCMLSKQSCIMSYSTYKLRQAVFQTEGTLSNAGNRARTAAGATGGFYKSLGPEPFPFVC